MKIQAFNMIFDSEADLIMFVAGAIYFATAEHITVSCQHKLCLLRRLRDLSQIAIAKENDEFARFVGAMIAEIEKTEETINAN